MEDGGWRIEDRTRGASSILELLHCENLSRMVRTNAEFMKWKSIS
jgi:hypothetical protein